MLTLTWQTSLQGCALMRRYGLTLLLINPRTAQWICYIDRLEPGIHLESMPFWATSPAALGATEGTEVTVTLCSQLLVEPICLWFR